jgi:hypothetical protein
MTVAEMTAESIKQVMPNAGKKLIYISGKSAQDSDYITVTGLSVVEGAVLIDNATGTKGTLTFATNVVTVTNATATTLWTGFAWGY